MALKTIANKLARACYFVLRDGVSFDMKKSFMSSVGLVKMAITRGETDSIMTVNGWLF